MGWLEIGKVIAKEAPLIATVLTATGVGAPASAAVAIAGKIASAALGVENTPSAVNAALAADPEALAKVRQAELENQVHLQELAVQAASAQLAAETARYQAEIADRDSARGREKAVQDMTNRNLAYVVVGAFIAMIGATLLGYAKVESVLAGTLVGYLSAKCEQVLAYYFGSTSGSARKTELLAKSPAVAERS